jgi:hypothetical protein
VIVFSLHLPHCWIILSVILSIKDLTKRAIHQNLYSKAIADSLGFGGNTISYEIETNLVGDKRDTAFLECFMCSLNHGGPIVAHTNVGSKSLMITFGQRPHHNLGKPQEEHAISPCLTILGFS